MSRLTDSIYVQWLRDNGSGAPSHADARTRGYGAQPHGRVVPRNVPGDVITLPPARPPGVVDVGSRSPALSRPAQGRDAGARGRTLARPEPSSSLEKQVFAASSNNPLLGYEKDPAAIFLAGGEDYYLDGLR